VAAVFISHSSEDRASAETIAAELRQRGCHSLFLDSDPAGGIRVGRDWERTLYQELAACQAVVVLCSPAALESSWVFAEITHARSLGKPLLPARIAPGETLPILADTQILDLVGTGASGYERLWEALRQAGVSPALELAADRCPYPGLGGFQPADAGVFFGRESQIANVIAALEGLRREGGAQLLLLTGAPGVGKRSLLRAGILPALQLLPDWLPLGPITPNGDAIAPLRGALAQLPEEGDDSAMERIVNSSATDFADAVRSAGGIPRATVVMIINCLELLLAQAEQTSLLPRSDQGLGARLLSLLGSGDETLLCISTLRADQRADLDASELAKLPRRELAVPPLEPRTFPEVISRPALAAGGELSAELVVALVEELRAGAELPYLALALRRFWLQSQGVQLTLPRFRSLVGDLAGCIDRSAERALDFDLRGAEDIANLRRVFRSLVRVGAEGQLLATALNREQVPTSARTVLERLVGADLISETNAEQDPAAPIALAHAAVFQRWRRLRQWLDEDLEFLRWRRRFATLVTDWQHGGPLLSRGELGEAERWAGLHQAELEPTSLELIAKSRAAIRRRWMLVITTTVVVISMLSGLSWYASRQRDAAQRGEAEALAQLATAHRLAAVDQRDRVGDLLLAAHHFAQVARLSTDATVAGSARRALGFLAGGGKLAEIDELGTSAEGAGETTTGDMVLWGSGALLVSPATGLPHTRPLATGERGLAVMKGRGDRFLSVRQERELNLSALDTATPEARLQLPGRLGGARPDGEQRTVLAWTDDGNVLRWDPDAASPRLFAHGGPVRGVLEAGDSDALVSFGSQPTARYWPADGGAERTLVVPHDAYAAAATSGQDPRVVLATGSESLLLWEPVSGSTKEIRMPRLVDQVRTLPVGTFLFWDGNGVIWRLQPGTDEPEQLHEHGDALTCVELSPEGTRLATCGLDSDVAIWRFGDAQSPPIRLRGACKGCRARFSPDGSTLLTWSDAGSLQRWDVISGQPLGLPMRHDTPVGDAFFGTDGQTLRSWSLDGEMRRWALSVTRPPSLSFASGASPLSVVAGADAGSVVYATASGDACHWSGKAADQPRCIALEGLPEPRLSGAVLSPDGTLVAGWRGSHIGVWSTADGARVGDLGGNSTDAPLFPGARFSADGQRLLYWGETGTSRLWDANPALELAPLRHPQSALDGDLSGDGGWSLLLVEGLARIWRTPPGEQPREWPEPTVLSRSGLLGATLSTDGQHALTWRDPGRVERWTLATTPASALVELPGLGEIRGAVGSTAGNAFLFWSGETALALEGSTIGPPLNQRKTIAGGALSADGRLAITWDAFDLRVWEPHGGTPETPALPHQERISGATIAGDSDWLTVWSRDSLRRWPLNPDLVKGDPVLWLQSTSGTRLADRAGPTYWGVELLPAEYWRALQNTAEATGD
jgi:WD40 repeat protein